MDRLGARDLPSVMLALRSGWMGMVFLSMGFSWSAGKGRRIRLARDSFQSDFAGGLICGTYERARHRVAPVAPVPRRCRGAALRPRRAHAAHDAAALDTGDRAARTPA